MKKEKKPFFEHLEFNDALYAKTVLEEQTKKLEKAKKGLILASIATVICLFCLKFGWGYEIGSVKDTIFAVLFYSSWILSLVSYVISGGIKVAFGIYLKILYCVWYIIPFFIIGLAITAMAAVVGLMAFLSVPVIFVGINYMCINQTKKEAEEYVSFCTPVE